MSVPADVARDLQTALYCAAVESQLTDERVAQLERWLTAAQVGSGRRHGEKPTEPGPELTLYEATHFDTAWREPIPEQVAPLIAWYYTLPGCVVGGSLHIVLDDFNVEDTHVRWCSGYASGQGDTCGSELAGLLERMSEADRQRAIDLSHTMPMPS
jgi:hypothetical protein